ncbi:MAG TPA: hypothetical protein IAB21_05695, partial [Candidatus Avelusimicrobium excrementipullorum]|nr:hypothetical protein [Candidatus Avelusimicrobium excrementipullorum]
RFYHVRRETNLFHIFPLIGQPAKGRQKKKRQNNAQGSIHRLTNRASKAHGIKNKVFRRQRRSHLSFCRGALLTQVTLYLLE